MKVEFLEEAHTELEDAIEYYNGQLTGLGNAFLQEVLAVIDRIAKYPEAWHPLSANTRRCQTRRFPYGLIYSLEGDVILVVSVSNLHRKPNHWASRIK